MSIRSEKVAKAIQREVLLLLHGEFSDPRLQFITITEATITPDLRYARMFYTCLGDDNAKKEARKSLRTATKLIRRTIGKRIKLKFAPEIVFEYDDTAEQTESINGVFKKIEEQRRKAGQGNADR
ncbi:MAG: 30S ribosome-binding factor RbfA [Candidatus Omnitrophica bacterium]|nr:30S ribosome-binding factor RbfA [Candidatus Omnitrophota bacterium]